MPPRKQKQKDVHYPMASFFNGEWRMPFLFSLSRYLVLLFLSEDGKTRIYDSHRLKVVGLVLFSGAEGGTRTLTSFDTRF